MTLSEVLLYSTGLRGTGALLVSWVDGHQNDVAKRNLAPGPNDNAIGMQHKAIGSGGVANHFRNSARRFYQGSQRPGRCN